MEKLWKPTLLLAHKNRPECVFETLFGFVSFELKGILFGSHAQLAEILNADEFLRIYLWEGRDDDKSVRLE